MTDSRRSSLALACASAALLVGCDTTQPAAPPASPRADVAKQTSAYAVTLLPTSPGSGFTFARAINKAGDVAIDEVVSGGYRLLLRLADGTLVPDPLRPSECSTRPVALNRNRVVVGSWFCGQSDMPLRWAPGARNTDPFATRPGRFGFASSINDAGWIVGARLTDEYHALLATPDGVVQDLGTLGGASAEATDVNNEGQVVGDSFTAPDSTSQTPLHAFLWSRRTGMIDIGTNATPRAINDRGEVVGNWFSANGNNLFYWSRSTGMIDLGQFNGERTYGLDINNRGEIIGISLDPSGPFLFHPFVKRVHGPFIPLPDLGSGHAEVSQINDCGRIVGGSIDASGTIKAVIWSDGRECR